MAIDMKLLNGFVWEHFKRFVASNPANADFPETHIEQKDGALTILHLGAETVGKYGFYLPEGQGKLEVNFQLNDEWRHLVHEYIQPTHGASFVDTLLAAYSEHIGEFIAGVPYDIEFTEEELVKIDAAREKSGETREEFIQSAITEKINELSAMERLFETKEEASFEEKLIERYGDDVIVKIVDDSDGVMFVVGRENSKVYMDELSNLLKTHTNPSQLDALRDAVSELMGRAKEEGGDVQFQFYRCKKDASPFGNASEHDLWLNTVAKVLVAPKVLPTFTKKCLERFGDEFIVRRLTSTEDKCRFVVGEKGSDVYVDKACAHVMAHDAFKTDESVLSRNIDTLVEESIEACSSNWLLIMADIDNDPFANDTLQDEWVDAIEDMLKGRNPK